MNNWYITFSFLSPEVMQFHSGYSNYQNLHQFLPPWFIIRIYNSGHYHAPHSSSCLGLEGTLWAPSTVFHTFIHFCSVPKK